MVIIICLFIGLAVFFILGSFTLDKPVDKSKLYSRLPAERGAVKAARMRAIFNPIFLLSQKIVEKLKMDETLRMKLSAGHVKLAPKEFFTIKIAIIIGLFVLTYFIFKQIDFLKGALCFFVGFMGPDFWLYRRIAKRKVLISRLLPETVDLIGLCIEAGQDFTMAVRWVLEKTRANPMLEELAAVMEEIKWGKPRSQALKDMAKRLNIPEVSSFVQTLVQAERMGTSVAETFSILSEDTRAQRFHKGEREALKAPLKILFPLLFFILPVIGIIIMGPVFLKFMSQKGSLGM